MTPWLKKAGLGTGDFKLRIKRHQVHQISYHKEVNTKFSKHLFCTINQNDLPGSGGLASICTVHYFIIIYQGQLLSFIFCNNLSILLIFTNPWWRRSLSTSLPALISPPFPCHISVLQFAGSTCVCSHPSPCND